jgi:hypothetical protein
MQISPFHSLVARLGGMFARPKEVHARATIDPASHVTEVEAADPMPRLRIGVRLGNARSEVIVSREALHE